MARRQNELFIGEKYLNIEGRSIKHPALIKYYATVNVNKISEKPIDLIGLDLETNHLTAELKLLGFYVGDKYMHYTGDFLEVLFDYIRYANHKSVRIAYWNRLDPFILYKQFLNVVDEVEVKRSMEQYGAISGEWNKKTKEWEVRPVIKVELGNWVFGIKAVIRSSLQFFYYDYESKEIKYVWAYDIAQLFQSSLEKEAESRLNYYSKVDKSAHLVDWDRFNNDKNYRVNTVLKSNELDARAVRDLGIIIQNEFFQAFKYYPRTLISQGSLARAAIVSVISQKYLQNTTDSKLAEKKAFQDIKAIGFIGYYDTWLAKYGETVLKDLFALTMEAYSGGYIEAIRYGFAKEAYYADLASAYPAVEVELYDLRDSKITNGEGEPPHIDYSYCFIRGTVNIPDEINFHPITVKHPLYKETNIRAVGKYKASYTIDERDYLISVGGTFENESWINIETKGKLSPLAEVVKDFIDLRKRLIIEGNSAQFMAKIAANSTYGILFEAVDTYMENEKGDILKAGYRAGEFLNPIFATYITAKTRIKLAKAAHQIEVQGGKVILLMTDSVFWTGSASMLPAEMIRAEKTLGYFETPELVKDMLCLGSGRYGFTAFNKKTEKWEQMISKKRGLNVVDIHDKNGIELDSFNWLEALKIVANNKESNMKVKVRALISIGMVKHSLKRDYHELGKVVEEYREVDLVVGKNKRVYRDDIKDPKKLLSQLINTEPIYLGEGMLGRSGLIDQTLPELRFMLMAKTAKSSREKSLKSRNKAQKKYYANSDQKEKYNWLRELGYHSKDARHLAKRSINLINMKLMEDNKI